MNLFRWGGVRGERREKREEKRVLRKREKKRKREMMICVFVVFLARFCSWFLRERFVSLCLCYQEERDGIRLKRVGGGGRGEVELVEVDDGRRTTSFFLFFSQTTSFFEKNQRKQDAHSFAPLSFFFLQDGVLRAHELAQLLRGGGHNERQGRGGAAPGATRHDGRTSGRGAAPENVGDEKGRLDIIRGIDNHDSGPELLVHELFLFFWRSC